jgi:hypothetical protein
MLPAIYRRREFCLEFRLTGALNCQLNWAWLAEAGSIIAHQPWLWVPGKQLLPAACCLLRLGLVGYLTMRLLHTSSESNVQS